MVGGPFCISGHSGFSVVNVGDMPAGPMTPGNNDIRGRWRRQDVNGQICSI